MPAHPFTHFQPATALFHPDNAVALARAAQLAYNSAAKIAAMAPTWGFPQCRFIARRETQLYVMANAKAIVVAFRGTEPDNLKDWMCDLDTRFVSTPLGLIHTGFHMAVDHVWSDLNACIREFQTHGQSLWLTGHSLGAALAILATARWREIDKPVNGLYNFGAPRVGDRVFERTFNQDFGNRTFRYVNNADLVTRVPLRAMGFSHVGRFLCFDEKGKVSADPGWWSTFLNRMEGRIADLGNMGSADLKQHSIDSYVALTLKNRALNPFA
jgi:triacylglycerol lipase